MLGPWHALFLLLALLLPVPTIAQSVLISNITGRTGPVALTWTHGETDRAFTVQTADSLQGSVWINASTAFPWPTALNTWSDPQSSSGTMKFYRVVAVPAAQRGALLANTSLGAYLQSQLALYAQAYQLPFTPVYGAAYHRLTYETIDPLGARTTATGLLCLPVGNPNPLRLVSYQHGTIMQKSGAPSSAPESSEGLLGIMLAGAGYAVVLPDYLGLGGSPGFHPYHHAVSQATAAVDMLRAARQYCASHSVPLSTNRLFLIGYSQGGHATMALHRELERFHTSEFSITASAPMAGAYDLSTTTTGDYLSGRAVPNPYYFAYILAAYQNVYRLTNSLANLLAAPYDTSLPPLLDGLHSESEINAIMPAVPSQILKPEILAAFAQDPRHPLRVVLRDNDVLDWTPVAPMRLWHCLGDNDVPFANSVAATNRFAARGVTVPLIDLDPTADHGGCSIPSLLGAKAWFDSFP